MKNGFLKKLRNGFLSLAVISGLAINIFTLSSCGIFSGNRTQDSTGDDQRNELVTPTDKDDVTPSKPSTPSNPSTPQGPSHDDDEKDDPTENDQPSNPPKEDEDPVKPPVTEPDDPVVDPVEPVEPDDPSMDEDIPTQADFAAFESKVKSVYDSYTRKNLIEIVSYSVENGKMTMFVFGSAAVKGIEIYELTLPVQDLSTHSNIAKATEELTKDNFVSRSPKFTLNIRKTDFSLDDGTSYSASTGYMEGKNIFADACGITKPKRTYFTTFSGRNMDSSFPTGHSIGLHVAVLYEENGITKLKHVNFAVQDNAMGNTDQESLDYFVAGKYRVYEEKIFTIGEDAREKSESIALMAQAESLTKEYGFKISPSEVKAIRAMNSQPVE